MKGEPKPVLGTPAFVPVALAAAPAAMTGDIRIELRRGPISAAATWPRAASHARADWMREILK